MRKYKFRAICKKTKEIYLFELDQKDLKISQFTHLYDRNGNEIYEGDIVVIPDQYPYYDNGKLVYCARIEYIENSYQSVFILLDKKRRGISHGINYEIECDDDGMTRFELLDLEKLKKNKTLKIKK